MIKGANAAVQRVYDQVASIILTSTVESFQHELGGDRYVQCFVVHETTGVLWVVRADNGEVMESRQFRKRYPGTDNFFVADHAEFE